MITVTHTCGHTQPMRADELWDRVADKHARGEARDPVAVLGKRRQQFIDEQIAFLEGNPCPGCYRQ